MKRTLLLVFLLLSSILTGCSLAGDVTPPPDYLPQAAEKAQPAAVQGQHYPLVAPSPARGAPIYAEKCAPCHGAQGLGDGPSAEKLTNPVAPIGDPELVRQSIPSDWYEVVRDGRMERFMPGFDSLTDGQRWDVLAYVYTLGFSADAPERGKQLYQEICAACHGEAGRGDGSQAAGATLPDFTDQEEMAGKSTASLYAVISSGAPPAMPAYADQLSEDERWMLSDYVRMLSFSLADSSAGVAAEPTENMASGVAPAPTTTDVVTATAQLTTTLGTGTVTGKITNGSGGEVPADLEVTVHGFDDMQLVISDTVPVETGGVFSLSGIEMPAGRAFIATTQYGQTIYGSEVGTVQEGQDLTPLDITIFESTSDTSSLVVNRMHMFFDFTNPAAVQVIELYIISNTSDKTVVSSVENGPVLEFTLPAGATNLQFQDGALGQRYLQTEAGFADTTPVLPSSGEYQVLFAFDMPYGRNLEIAQPINLPVESVVVLFPDDGIRLKSATLQDDGTRDVQGVAYRIYSSEGLQPGSTLDMTLSGRPSGGNILSNLGDRSNLVLGLGALGLALVVAGVLLYRRSRDQDEASEEDGDIPLDAAEEDDTPESLMDAIIALDDLYQEGQLPEEAYQARRAELKERLREIQAS